MSRVWEEADIPFVGSDKSVWRLNRACFLVVPVAKFSNARKNLYMPSGPLREFIGPRTAYLTGPPLALPLVPPSASPLYREARVYRQASVYREARVYKKASVYRQARVY